MNARPLSLPLRFEPNRGQSSDDGQFLAYAGDYEIHFSSSAVTLQPHSATNKQTTSLTVAFEGADKRTQVVAAAPLPGKSNYLRESDKTSWLTDVPNFGQLQYRGIYPGVDLFFYGNRGRLEYDFVVSPHADPDTIALRLPKGANAVVTAAGDLGLEANGPRLELLKPVAYQLAADASGRRQEVQTAYRIVASETGPRVKFTFGEYDHSRPLVIDPVLVYSNIGVGGGTLTALAVDGSGNVYIATNSSGRIAVTKLSSDGSTVLYNTVIGSGYSSQPTSIAVDSNGQAHVVGYSDAGYPTTNSAYRPVSSGGNYHVVYTELNAAGDDFIYSTYIPGSSTDYAQHVAVDSGGKAYISGLTYSSDYPNTGSTAFAGYSDGFLTKIDPTLSGDASLVYSVIVPAGYTYASVPSVAVDANQNAYLAIDNDQMVTTPGAYDYSDQIYYTGGSFVSKYDPTGALVYTAYLGDGDMRDIAVDGSGSVYVTGLSQYGQYPSTSGAYQTTYPYGYVSKLDPTGANLVYSTYLGGPSGQVQPESIALPAGCASNCVAYVAGSTGGDDFPTVSPIQPELAGYQNAFVVLLSGDGSSASFSTYLGGSYYDELGQGDYSHIPELRLDASGNAYLASNTESSDFPFTTESNTSGPYVVKIGPSNGAALVPSSYNVNLGSAATIGVSVQQSVILRNFGTATLTFTVATTGDFAESDNCGGSIAPGGSCTAQITFTATLAGQRYGTVTFTNNGVISPTQISVTGYAYDHAELTLSAQQLQFGAQPAGAASSPQSFTVTNIGTQPASISSISLSDSIDFSQTNNCPSELPVQASCTINVTFAPVTVGEYSYNIYVSASAAFSGNYWVSLYGTGTLTGSSSAVVSPASVNFPDQLVGVTSPTQYIYVSNTGTIPITMGGGAVTGDFSIYSDGCGSNQIVYPGNQCQEVLQFKPTAAGARTGTLTISSTAAGFPQVLNLTGNGVTPVSGVSITPAAMQFAGQVQGTASSYQAIVITNVGNNNVMIDHAYSTDPDFLLDNSGCALTTIAPLNTCTISVIFKPTTSGPLTGSIVIIDSDPTSPQTVALSGNGLSPASALVITPDAVGFNDTLVGASLTTTIAIYNPDNSPVSISSVTANSPDFLVSYNGCSTVYANSSCSISVTFQPASAGAKSATLTLVDTAPGSPHTVSLAGNAIAGAESLVATPQAFQFNDQVVGTNSYSEPIVLYNSGTSQVTISEVAAGGDFDATSNCSTIYPGSYCTEYVTFSPTAAGLRTGTFTIFDDAPGNPHTVALSGVGLTATSTVMVSPPDPFFTDQAVGTTSTTQTITFYNTGNNAVTVTNDAVSGDFAIAYDECAAAGSIAPNSYCYVTVSFTPTATGTRTGALTMNDNAPGSPHGANLSGNGLAASQTLTLYPATLAFGNQLQSATPSQTMYVVNSGTEPVNIASIVGSSSVSAASCASILNVNSSCPLSVTFTIPGTGAQSGTVTVTSNAAGSPQAVNVTANGVASSPAATVAPSGLAFAPQLVAQTSSTQSAQFTNHSGATVTVTGVTASGDFSVGTNNCSSVANGSSCSVNVQFTPTASGVRTGTLMFNYGTSGQVSIGLNGYGIAPAISAETSPGGLTFLDQVVGTASSVQIIYLYSLGTQPVSISNTSITGDFSISASACSGTVSNYCYVEVAFQPTASGARTGTLTITDNSPTSPHVISLNGTGDTPTNTLEIGATQLAFPDQPVNTTSSQTQYVYVTNTGNAVVHLNSPTLTGDFATAYNSCSATLGPKSSCYVSFTFTPTALGARSGSFTLTSDSSSGTLSLTLGGNGIAGTKSIVVSNTALEFPDSPVGVAGNTQYFYIYNNGTLPVTLTAPTVTGDFSIPGNECSVISVKSYCYMYVGFTPTQTGTRTGTLTLNDDAAGNPQTISLTGQGDAVVHSARLSISSMVFASQPVGLASSSQYVYLYNQGNVPLNVSNVSISGDFVLGSSSCGTAPFTIAVNSYCYSYIGFTPTQTGMRTGTLSFADDATNSPQVLNLSGVGVAANPQITSSTSSLVFPPQEVNTASATQYVYIYSQTNVPITFGAASIDNPEFTIYYTYCSSFSSPGQSCYYGIQFTPSSSGPQSGTLTIPSNANGSPIKVSLSGTGIAAGTGGQLSQTSITFGNQAVGIKSPAVNVFYTNAGASNIVISTVVTTGDFSTTGGCNSTTIGVKSYCEMAVSFTPTATGTRTGSITITDNTAQSPKVIMLSGTGVSTAPTAILTPIGLQFGNQLVGVPSSSQTFNLANTGSAALTVSAVTINPSTDFNITSNGCASGVPANSSCYIYIVFTPSAAGARSATLTIVDNDAGSPHTAPLGGTGIASSPIVSLSGPLGSFGNYAVATTSPASGVTLSNTGNAALSITSITTSAEFSATNSCGTGVAANGSCNINVKFTPAATGNRTGTLTIVDNAPGSPHILGLSGTGIDATGSQVSPANLIFANQAVSTTSSQQTITIQSTGASLTVGTVSTTGDFAQTNGCTSALGYTNYCYVNVTFTPTAVGNRTGTLTITDNSPTSPHVIPLTGNGTGSPAVNLSAASLTFASFNTGTTSPSQPVTLTNNGTGPLGVGSVVASGDFAQTNTCGTNVNAGASCTISVTFTPTTYGNRTGSLTITDSAASSPQTVTLSGTGLAPGASASPTSLTFATQAVGSSSTAQSITLSNPGTVNTVVSSITISTTAFTETNNCTTIAPNGSCTINVKFAPAGAGLLGATLQVISNAPMVSVPLSGTGTGPVASLNQSSLSFGNVAVGSTSSTQVITLTSTGDSALTIGSITASGEFSQSNNCPASLASGGNNCNISVTFSPTTPGAASGQVTIVDNAANSPQLVSLSGTGIGAALTFSPSSLNFSTVLLNSTSAALAIQITNTGTANLSFTSVTTTGDFAETNNCVSPLAPSASCTANVTFTPTATGVRTGSLSVAASSGNFTAALSGTGVTQGLTFSPGSLSFAPTVVGNTAASQALTVTNVGTSPVTISSVGITGDFAQTNNCVSVLPASSTCTVNVTFTPTAQGPRSGTISFTDGAPGSPQTVSLSGTGTAPTADLALTGNVSPKAGPPGETATYVFIVTNNGPSPASNVAMTISVPSSGSLQSVNATAGACAGTGPINCTVGGLSVGASVTVTMVLTNIVQGPMTSTASITATEFDPTLSNNTLSLTSDTSGADIQVIAASATTTLSGQPAFTMGVTNNGPANATNVMAAFDLETFGYVNSVASQGGCSWNGVQVVCALGPLNTGATASITIAIAPPNSGWASIEAHASADQYDPVPSNNLVQFTPTPEGDNTGTGTNVAVHTTDPVSGSKASLLFASVTHPGITAMAATNAALPPAGYRAARTVEAFDVTTSAAFGGPVTFSLQFAPGALWHPSEARLFHWENGEWADRTTALDPSGTIVAKTASLSQFAIFEPPDQPPVANPGVAQVVAASASANQVQLNGAQSSDPENDSLTYRWTGPFPEGNGTVTGLNPAVTLPVGVSEVTLVVNDGELDSVPVGQSITVSDFTVSAGAASVTIPRGQSANLMLVLSPKFGAYDRPVTLECADLPADLQCQFAQTSATPGANGTSVNLTLTASASASRSRGHSSHVVAVWILGMGFPFGLVIVSGDRRRRAAKVAVLAMVLLVLYLSGCGGSGSSSQTQTPPPPAASVSTIDITASSGGIQHSVAVTVTRN